VLEDHRLAVRPADPPRPAPRSRTLQADEEKLRAVAANLVSNAVNIPGRGMISLALRNTGRRSRARHCDAAPGFPVEDREGYSTGSIEARTLPGASARSGSFGHREGVCPGSRGRIEILQESGPGAAFSRYASVRDAAPGP